MVGSSHLSLVENPINTLLGVRASSFVFFHHSKRALASTLLNFPLGKYTSSQLTPCSQNTSKHKCVFHSIINQAHNNIHQYAILSSITQCTPLLIKHLLSHPEAHPKAHLTTLSWLLHLCTSYIFQTSLHRQATQQITPLKLLNAPSFIIMLTNWQDKRSDFYLLHNEISWLMSMLLHYWHGYEA